MLTVSNGLAVNNPNPHSLIMTAKGSWWILYNNAMIEPIIVKHQQGSYPIHFVAKLNEATSPNGPLAKALQTADDFAIVVNHQVEKIYQQELARFAKDLDCKHAAIIIPDGEEHKNLSTLENLSTQLSKLGLSRQSMVVAVGGGVTTDLVGFVAASYMRGIGYVHIPTTLLAQVDASIGGKTGVNLASGKNLVGAFHQPQLVLINSGFLASLPPDEIACGFAEIIKHGLLADAKFFHQLEQLPSLGDLPQEQLLQIIHHACKIKVDIVQQDEREQRAGGRDGRALLNLGHTFAHALEGMSSYKELKHGQAVALGLIFASRASKLLGKIDDNGCRRVEAILEKFALPHQLPDNLSATEMLEFMMRDKKRHHQGVPLILLNAIGKAYMSNPYTQDELKDMLQHLLTMSYNTG